MTRTETDDSFRAALLSDPRSTLETELNMEISEGTSVHVHEESLNDVHLVLPPSHSLSADDLRQVSGGDWPWVDLPL